MFNPLAKLICYNNVFKKFVKFLEICKQFSHDLVNEEGNIARRDQTSRFSDLEVIALSMASEAEEIDSEKWLFESKLNECRHLIPNLISRRQFNEHRKVVASLCEQIRGRIANHIDGGEDYFCIDSKPIELCRLARADAFFSNSTFYYGICKYGFHLISRFRDDAHLCYLYEGERTGMRERSKGI